MKKIIIMLLSFVIQNIKAQCDDLNSKNTISTNWTSFNNTSQYPNNWNWTLSGNSYKLYLYDNMNDVTGNVDSRIIYAELPYFCTQQQGQFGCENDNLLQYHLLGNYNQDIYPVDGWELIGKNFGTPNSSLNSNDGKGVQNPFFVLYNKYNGKLKIYTAVIGSHTANKAMITFMFDDLTSENLKSALLAHAKPIAQPLQTFEPLNTFKTLNAYELRNHTDDYYWLVSEIQTAYDPCTCMGFNKNSLLKFITQLVTTSTITGTIEGTTSQTLADASTVKSETNKKTSFYDLAIDIGKAGFESYNKWDGYKDKVNNGFENFNKAYKDKLVEDWFDANIGKYYGYLYNPQTKIEALNAYKSSDDNLKKIIGIQGVDKYNKYSGAIKGIASSLPYVGTVIGVTEFFIGLSKKNNSGVQTELPPVTYFTNFKLKGEITNKQEVSAKAFYNPGHPVKNSVEAFTPFYNNPLGIFHILKAPQVEYHKLEKQLTIFKANNQPQFDIIEDDATNVANLTDNVRQWYITEDIKYVVNPASDLEVESIDACFVLQYNKEEDIHIPANTGINTITPVPYGDNYYKLISLEDRIEDIEKYGLELEYLTKNYPTDDNSYIRFRTQYAPLQCLKNLSFVTIGGNGGNMKVYVKMLVRLKVKNSNNFVTQIVMYDISSKFLEGNAIENSNKGSFQISIKANEVGFFGSGSSGTPDGRNWEYEKLSITLPKENINFNSKIIDFTTGMGNSTAKEVINIKANQHIGDNITLIALEDINIESGVTFGNNVLLRAGNSINVAHDVEITPNTTLEIIEDIQLFKINCTNPDITSLHATNSEITSICTSSAYISRAESIELPKNEPKNYEKDKLNFKIYPNPNNGNFYINLDHENESWELTLYDMTGKQILNQNIEKGQKLTYLQTNNLTSGVYIVTVKSNGLEKTERIIIQNNN